jgi:hypothetical protein
MSPEQLAVMHSQVIDHKLQQMTDVFTGRRAAIEKLVTPVLQKLIVDDKGNCVKCKQNKALVNKALGIMRRELRQSRPIIHSLYNQGIAEIDLLATDYITWLKSE